MHHAGTDHSPGYKSGTVRVSAVTGLHYVTSVLCTMLNRKYMKALQLQFLCEAPRL